MSRAGRDLTRSLLRYSWEDQNGELRTEYFPSFQKCQKKRELRRCEMGTDVGAIEWIRLKGMPPYTQLIEALNDIEELIIECRVVRPARKARRTRRRVA